MFLNESLRIRRPINLKYLAEKSSMFERFPKVGDYGFRMKIKKLVVQE